MTADTCLRGDLCGLRKRLTIAMTLSSKEKAYDAIRGSMGYWVVIVEDVLGTGAFRMNTFRTGIKTGRTSVHGGGGVGNNASLF